jgi:hypothetical protein
MFFTQFQFINTYFRSDPPVLVRDIDNFGDPRIVAAMAYGTGTPQERARHTTLGALEGVLLEKHTVVRDNHWIRPVGVRHRNRSRGGQRYCPQCLGSDARPYLRRRWRLAAISTCSIHHVALLDRCPECTSPLMPHRTALGLNRCWRCETDLALAPALPALPGALAYSELAAAALDQGWVSLGAHTFHYSPLFFVVLRQITRVIASGKRSQQLRDRLGQEAQVSKKPFDLTGRNAIEFLDAAETHRLHALAWPLLKDWPSGYVEHMRAAGVWAAWATRDLLETPFVLRQIVDQHLRLDLYSPPFAEVFTAVRVMSGQGHRISNKGMRRVIGDSHFLGPAISLFRSSITPTPPSRRALRQAATRSASASERHQPPSATRAVIVRTIRSE